MDPTKAPVAAMTMVKGDPFFLERWVNYYKKHLPPEHIYIVSHGNDPEVARIAEGTNIIGLPYDPSRRTWNQRRWQMLSLFVTGMTRYYNWVICNDVDEIVAVDPDVSDSLVDYLSRFEEGKSPRVITPFSIEMVHTPKTETDPITPEGNILAVRRNYRLNSNYAKPCVTRFKVDYMPGGHGSDQKQIFIDPHLFIFHLRFIDYEMCMGRLIKGRENRLALIKDPEERKSKKGKWGWNNADKVFDALSKQTPVAETVDHPDFRKKMLDEKQIKGAFTLMGGGRSKEIYRLPERFAKLF